MSVLKAGKTAKVSKAKQAELEDMLTSWAKIHAQVGSLSELELQKAVFLEHKINGASRPRVLKRLLGALGSRRRADDLEALGLAA